MDYLEFASEKLNLTIRLLQACKDAELEEIINNLKHEEEKLDSIIMNREDSQ